MVERVCFGAPPNVIDVAAAAVSLLSCFLVFTATVNFAMHVIVSAITIVVCVAIVKMMTTSTY